MVVEDNSCDWGFEYVGLWFTLKVRGIELSFCQSGIRKCGENAEKDIENSDKREIEPKFWR